jgi:hypothetical protein
MGYEFEEKQVGGGKTNRCQHLPVAICYTSRGHRLLNGKGGEGTAAILPTVYRLLDLHIHRWLDAL